jgi:hypothetical protein
VVFGTDYPAKMILDDGVAWINGLDVLGSEEKAALLFENAAPLLEPATSANGPQSREGAATRAPIRRGEPDPEPSAP